MYCARGDADSRGVIENLAGTSQRKSLPQRLPPSSGGHSSGFIAGAYRLETSSHASCAMRKPRQCNLRTEELAQRDIDRVVG